MTHCLLCEEQAKKLRNGKPHPHLQKADQPRLFRGANPQGYEEQDYQCEVCNARFTHSTNRNDLAWTLWRG